MLPECVGVKKDARVGPTGTLLTNRQVTSSTASKDAALARPELVMLLRDASVSVCRNSIFACIAWASTGAPSWKTARPGAKLKRYVRSSGVSQLSASSAFAEPSSVYPNTRS